METVLVVLSYILVFGIGFIVGDAMTFRRTRKDSVEFEDNT